MGKEVGKGEIRKVGEDEEWKGGRKVGNRRKEVRKNRRISVLVFSLSNG